jgi:hypothetical protein
MTIELPLSDMVSPCWLRCANTHAFDTSRARRRFPFGQMAYVSRRRRGLGTYAVWPAVAGVVLGATCTLL